MTDSTNPWFLVLTSANAVADDAVKQALDFLGSKAGPVKRLADSAVEISMIGKPAHAGLLVAGVDVNAIAAAFRQKLLLVADMDSTIISVECIDELADYAGVKDRVAAITTRAMNGELAFDQALRERVALLIGLPETVLAQCYQERVKLNAGASTLVKVMNSNGATTALVSGGFTYFADKVAEAAGFQFCRANRLVIANGALTGEVASPIIGQSAKIDALVAMRRKAGLDIRQTLAVGDGANDALMIKEAGLGVAYKGKPSLKAVATAVLEHSDLTALLAFQGYRESGTQGWVR